MMNDNAPVLGGSKAHNANIILSLKQSAVVTQIVQWFKSRLSPQLFSVGGYAGVGKSTCVKYAIEAMGLTNEEVAFVTFTGKAALVLTRKGNPAMTIHRFCYEPNLKTYKDEITGLPKTKISGFRKRMSAPEGVKLLVIDEVSMVGDNLLRDLLSFGIKILALGDPGQLSPVMGKDNGILKRPDAFLDEIHRQAADSPIIWASMLARQGRTIPHGVHGDALRVVSRYTLDVQDVLGVDQVIACTHKTRRYYNTLTRDFLGYDINLPLPGEKLICLSNRWEDLSSLTFTPMVNGLQVRVHEMPYRISKNLRSFWTSLEMEGVPGDYYMATEVNLDWFDPIPNQEPDTDADMAHFDYGYAITCHKSQGSEWGSVLFINDGFGDDKSRREQLYTGITRASQFLTIAL